MRSEVISYQANKDRVSDWQDVGLTCDNYASPGANLLWVKQWSIMRISAWKSGGDNPVKHLTTAFYEFFIPPFSCQIPFCIQASKCLSKGVTKRIAVCAWLENPNAILLAVSLIVSKCVFEWRTELFGVFSLQGAKFSQSFNLLRVFHKSYPKTTGTVSSSKQN